MISHFQNTMKNIIIVSVLGLLLTSIVASANELDVELGSRHIRSLAASCAACHGTNGNSVGHAAKLAGIEKSDFLAKILAFKSGERKATVMNKHAKGLNVQEIEALAIYFSTQTPHQPTNLTSQVLNQNHEN